MLIRHHIVKLTLYALFNTNYGSGAIESHDRDDPVRQATTMTESTTPLHIDQDSSACSDDQTHTPYRDVDSDDQTRNGFNVVPHS